MANDSSIRIIGGKWRGRKISFPAVNGLRPTHDRIRETLFNWLMQDIVGAHCLDLFAGSGALGFEALSRGATEVTFVEHNAKAAASLSKIITQLDVAGADVIPADYRALPKLDLDLRYNIVFLDPPFDSNLHVEATQWLEANNYLSEDAIIYLEVKKGTCVDGLPKNWECSRHKSTSTIDYYLFKRNSV